MTHLIDHILQPIRLQQFNEPVGEVMPDVIAVTPLDIAMAVCKSVLKVDLMVAKVDARDAFHQEYFYLIAQEASLIPSDVYEYTVAFQTLFKYTQDVRRVMRVDVASKIDRALYASSQTWKVRGIRSLMHTTIMRDITAKGPENLNEYTLYINLIAFKLVRVGIFELSGLTEPLYVDVPESQQHTETREYNEATDARANKLVKDFKSAAMVNTKAVKKARWFWNGLDQQVKGLEADDDDDHF